MATVARPRPQVNAALRSRGAALRDAIGKADRPVAGVRVVSRTAACAGMSYTMEYAETVTRRRDRRRPRRAALIDPKAVLFLLGTEMTSPHKTDKLSRGSCSTTPTRPRPAAAESPSPSPPPRRMGIRLSRTDCRSGGARAASRTATLLIGCLSALFLATPPGRGTHYGPG